MGGGRGPDQDRRLQELENKVDRLLREIENLRRDLRGDPQRGGRGSGPRTGQPDDRGGTGGRPGDRQPGSRGGAGELPGGGQPGSRGGADELPLDRRRTGDTGTSAGAGDLFREFSKDFGKVTQETADVPESDWQVAYDERELSRAAERARFAFFFHDLDLKKPLLTSFGPVSIPKESPVPAHLKDVEYMQP